MVRNNDTLGKSVGRRDSYENEDFSGRGTETLEKDKYRVVATRQSSATNWYIHGHGTPGANEGYLSADFQDSAGNDIQGRLRFAVYGDERLEDPKAFGQIFDLEELREAEHGERTERPQLFTQRVGAKEDQYVAIEIKVKNSASDGETVDAANSNYQVPLSEVPQR